jgi:hypothetical protein
MTATGQSQSLARKLKLPLRTIVVLFENKERTSQDPKSYIESDWDYLDRSGRSEAQRVRDFLSQWVLEYPESERAELIARITCGDQTAFRSATFELALFALLRSKGCAVTVHPDLPNENTTHPDFLVVTPDGDSVYVEAVLASEYSDADISARKRTDAVLNSIEKIDSPNFFLGVNADGHPERPPSAKQLRRDLERWLASLDPDMVAHEVALHGHDAIPTMKWNHEDWNIVFEAIPTKPERRGQGQRVIGAISGGARWVNVWEPLRDAVKAKGNRYGELPYPLLIAINVDSLFGDGIDEMQGLFGQEEFVLSVDDSTPPMMRRKPNGAWFGPEGPQYTRVSGAWIFSELNPWNIVSRKNTVYFNPWAAKPLPAIFLSVHHAKIEGEKMQWSVDQSLGEILSLSEKWPEQD